MEVLLGVSLLMQSICLPPDGEGWTSGMVGKCYNTTPSLEWPFWCSQKTISSFPARGLRDWSPPTWTSSTRKSTECCSETPRDSVRSAGARLRIGLKQPDGMLPSPLHSLCPERE